MTRTQRLLPTLLLVSASAAALAGCKIDDRPLLARGGPPAAEMGFALPPAYQGELIGLPEAPPAQVAWVGEDRAYLYPERAYRFERAAYRQAPDHAFRYGQQDPWAWQEDDGMMFAEPYDDGYRFYYYEPDEPYPYFVRDEHYGYAYGDNGVLLALFSAAGALLSPNTYGQYAPVAGRYWVHANELNQAYWSAPRYPVQQVVWTERAPLLWAVQDPWFQAAESYEPWRVFRTRYADGYPEAWYDASPVIYDEPRYPSYAPTYRAPAPEYRDYAPQPSPSVRVDNGKAWKEARKAEQKGWKEERKAEARWAREERKDSQHWAKEARKGADDHGRQAHQARKDWEKPHHGGGRQFASNASGHGQDAGWRGPDRNEGAKAHGRGEHNGGGHGGGGGDHGKGGGGGGHGKGGGGDHGKGGGHGGGGGDHGKGGGKGK
jgi:hypothetical protein